MLVRRVLVKPRGGQQCTMRLHHSAPHNAMPHSPAAAGGIVLPEKLLPFVLFMFVGSITPGPNTMISTASGAAFGFVRTLPQMLGVSVGFPLMIAALGFGLGEIFRQQPWLHEVLRYAGAAFLLYLAWRIAKASGPERTEAKRPLTFIEAALFQ